VNAATESRTRIDAVVDEAIVLGVKRHGEASAILEVMTREHGRHLGLVRGAAGVRLRPVLQPGNRVSVTWRHGWMSIWETTWWRDSISLGALARRLARPLWPHAHRRALPPLAGA